MYLNNTGSHWDFTLLWKKITIPYVSIYECNDNNDAKLLIAEDIDNIYGDFKIDIEWDTLKIQDI